MIFTMDLPLLFLLTSFLVSESTTNSNVTLERALISDLLQPGVYDGSIQPSAISGKPTTVEIDLVLNSVGPVNDRDMVMTASFYLRQEWKDPRLEFDDFNKTLVMSEKKLSSLWVPDLFFPESTVESRHDITTPNVLIRVKPDGTVLYSQRLTVTMQCKMDLFKFPMDDQVCAIKMESYGYTTEDIIFTWSKARGATSIMPNAYIPDFSLVNVSAHDCTSSYATGSFTCIEAKLSLVREIGFYATQTFVPSILIVVLSWASFWIDHEAVPARISVGLLTVLTITTQSSGARSQLPRVPYVKAIDVWMSACLVFVFSAYMEYAVVTVLSRRYKKQKAREAEKPTTQKSTSTSVASLSDVQVYQNPDVNVKSTKTKKDTNTGRFVDKLSRFFFPFSFIIFNIVFWVFYKVVP